jgi:hypothetical protein
MAGGDRTAQSYLDSMRKYSIHEEATLAGAPRASGSPARSVHGHDAARRAVAFEPFGLTWLEEPSGLGVDVDRAVLKEFLKEVEIRVAGKTLYRTPAID